MVTSYMPIKPACEVSFALVQRCPACNIEVLPCGDQEPLAVDSQGRVYCRDHGQQIAPNYPDVLKMYRQERLTRRREAIRRMNEEDAEEDSKVPR